MIDGTVKFVSIKLNDKDTSILHRDGLTSLNMIFLANVKSKNSAFVSICCAYEGISARANVICGTFIIIQART